MCTWITEIAKVSGSGKSPRGWLPLKEARVYYDHPFYTPADHTLNIDFVNPDLGLDARVAVELTDESARALVKAIEAALETAEGAHSTAAD